MATDYTDTRKNVSKTMLGNLAETLGFKKGLSYKQVMTEAASLSQKAVKQGLKRAGWKGALALGALEAAGYGASKAYEAISKSKTKTSDKAVSGNYAMDESANKPVNKNKTDRPTVTKPKATERTYERFRKEPKPVPKGLREGIAKDTKKVTPKVEDTKKQLMMKEKYSGKDSNVKFNAKGGMMKKYSKGGMTKKGKK